MTRAKQDDLRKTNISDYFARLRDSLHSLSKDLESFNSSSESVLKGNGFDAIRSRIRYYIDGVEKSAKICDSFQNNVIAANNDLIVYMDDLSDIDNSLYEEIDNLLSQAIADLSRLESYYEYTYTNPYTGKTESTWLRVGSDAQIAECKDQIEYLKHVLEKMAGLEPADAKAFRNLNSVSLDIINLNTAVNGINVMNYSPSPLASLSREYTDAIVENAYSELEKYAETWPKDISKDRVLLMAIAFSYLDKGYKYPYSNANGNNRGLSTNNKDYPEAKYYDCSYLITEIIRRYQEAKGETPIAQGASTYAFLGTGDDGKGYQNFLEYAGDGYKILPGDIILHFDNGNATAYGQNHIIMCVGYNEAGAPMFIESTTKSTGPSSIRISDREDIVNDPHSKIKIIKGIN